MNRSNVLQCIIVLSLQKMACCQTDQKTNQKKFPDIFYMDDYYECSKIKDNSYCTADMNLISKDVKSRLWIDIQDWSIPRYHYNHTVIHRTHCIPSKYKGYLERKIFIESITNQELKAFNLSAKMFSMDCKEEKNYGIDMKIILFGIFVYMSIILLATICEKVVDEKSKKLTIGKWLIICFSLTSNWKKLTQDKNPDYEKLKCLQGIRTYQTILVISCHSLMAVGQLSIRNTSLVEQLLAKSIMQLLLLLFVLMIQTYFVISTWLLTNQVLEMNKKNGRFSLRDGLVLFLHRVSRFWAPLLFMIFIGANIFVNLASGPGNFGNANFLGRNCRNNWWATLFQVTNFLPISEVCNLAMWSLSIDTQFYIISIVFLYVALKYNLNIKKYLFCMFIIAYMINVVTFYQGKFPILSYIHLKCIKRIDFYYDEMLPTSYFGFWINSSSSLIGILFGYLYFLRKENHEVTALEKLCGSAFAIFPIAAVLLGSLDASNLVSALLGPLLKPMFGFGIGCGIYGMSRNFIQGMPKSVCENKYAVLLGNFTFSTYVHHFMIIFAKGSTNTSPIEISLIGLVFSLVMEIFQSFAIGIFSALVIEQPAINVKKMILPDLKRNIPSKEQTSGHKYKNKQN